jgi:hypothetical protein
MLKRSEVFFPYFASRVRFDNRRCRVALRESAIEALPLRDYFEPLVEFALAADWGRRPIPRAARRSPQLSARRARRRDGQADRALMVAR